VCEEEDIHGTRDVMREKERERVGQIERDRDTTRIVRHAYDLA
jgi:hypothetical protein